ncbi:MAG: carbohydrate kinase family protein [Chloroflexi bacterium]|nr:carbohydrate kinase family protein [Chloroflexota bacterium]
MVGDDVYGRFMLTAMQERSIDISHCLIDPTLQTGLPSSWQNRMATAPSHLCRHNCHLAA